MRNFLEQKLNLATFEGEKVCMLLFEKGPKMFIVVFLLRDWTNQGLMKYVWSEIIIIPNITDKRNSLL